ncbi:hypothetical protein LguiA_003955 [Lonicera macranthoides]
MATPLLFRGIPLLRSRIHHQHHRLVLAVCLPTRRPWSTAPEPIRPDENLSSEKTTPSSAKPSPKLRRWEHPDYCKWKVKEKEILEDIEPIIFLTKNIIHSHRYMDGDRLDAEDEKAVVDKLLAYHPHFEDKIGCGLDSIMVDRHPIFRHSRCLFVVRTDGGWIDFSYQKCLREYIRQKYPSHAERFISEHFKRGSSRLIIRKLVA